MARMIELLAGGAAISGTAYLVGSAISYSMYKREKAKSKWLETTGMLALVELKPELVGRDDDSSWEVVAEYWYEYQANEKTEYSLADKTRHPTVDSPTESDLLWIRNQIDQNTPLGFKRTIRYDPKFPNKADVRPAGLSLDSAHASYLDHLALSKYIAISVLLLSMFGVVSNLLNC